MAHPALSKDRGGHRIGNYGLLDPIEALDGSGERPAFGGDRARPGLGICGRRSSLPLLGPRSQGVFQRAVIQSGGLGT